MTETLEEEGGTGPRLRDDRVERALALATAAHRGQRDRFGRDFIEHPVAVAELCLPFTGTAGLVPAYLHDTIEKAGVDPAEIERSFGPETRSMIEVLGQDGSIDDPEERRDDHRRRVAGAGPVERAVYLNDRRDGILTLTGLLGTGRDPGEFEAARRLALWQGDLEVVEPGRVDPTLDRAIRAELAALAALLG